MTNNDTFRTLLHLTGLGLDDDLLLYIFSLGGVQASKGKIRRWREKSESARASHMPDDVLKSFFQGLFSYRDMMASKGINVFNFIRNQ